MFSEQKRQHKTAARPRDRRWLRCGLVAVLVSLLVYGLTVFAIDRKVRSAQSAYEQGVSLSFDDYIQPPLEEGTANGTDYMEAAALLTDGQKGVYLPRDSPAPTDLKAIYRRYRVLEVARGVPTPEDLELFRSVVERQSLALAVLDRGMEEALEARYRTNYEDPPLDIIIPNLLIRLRFATLLRARSELALAEGRGAEAWRGAEQIFRLAHWTGRDLTTLINVLVARAVARQGFLLTQDLLATTPPDAGTRKRLLEEARRTDPRKLFGQAFAVERSVTFQSLNDPRVTRETIATFGGDSGGDSTAASWSTTQYALLAWQPWRRLNAALYLELATSRFEVCALTTHEQEEPQQRLDALMPPSWAQPARQALFGCLGAGHKRDLWLASLDHLEIALRLEEVRESAGVYPADLAVLGGTSWVDPFSGGPYHYRLEGDGYVLYSVSINGVDDGGALAPAGVSGNAEFGKGDLVWRVVGSPAVPPPAPV